MNQGKEFWTSLLHGMCKVRKTVSESRNEVNFVSFLVDCRDIGLSVDVKLPLLLVQKSGGLRPFREECGEGELIRPATASVYNRDQRHP